MDVYRMHVHTKCNTQCIMHQVLAHAVVCWQSWNAQSVPHRQMCCQMCRSCVRHPLQVVTLFLDPPAAGGPRGWWWGRGHHLPRHLPLVQEAFWPLWVECGVWCVYIHARILPYDVPKSKFYAMFLTFVATTFPTITHLVFVVAMHVDVFVQFPQQVITKGINVQFHLPIVVLHGPERLCYDGDDGGKLIIVE